MGDPYTLSAKLNTSGPGSNVPGTDALEDLFGAGLANVDNSRRASPVLALAVPTVENGQWTVFPEWPDGNYLAVTTRNCLARRRPVHR